VARNPGQPPTPLRRAWLWAEMGVLFFGIPAVYAAMLDPQHRFEPVFDAIGLDILFNLGIPPQHMLFPLLLGTTALIVLFLLLDPTFEKRRLWDPGGAERELTRQALLLVVLGPALVGAAWAGASFTDLLPSNAFLHLPRERTGLWLAIMCLYPLFSAYPQEITHRAFFFHRYVPILPRPAVLIGVNTVAFAFMHIVFWNWVAIVLTFAGGLLFAWTYHRSRSTLAAALEHAVYGNIVFTVGLGGFVFTGSPGH